MRNDKLASLQNYLRWLLAQYQLQQQTKQDAYRIVDQETENGETRLTIQVIGKSITFKAKPEELAADDQIMERFSRKDVRTITFYACHAEKRPRARIVFQEFREKLNKMIFGIRKPHSETIIEKTAAQISLDKNLLNQMSQEEAHLIGYTTATEQMVLEKAQLEKLKSQASSSDTDS